MCEPVKKDFFITVLVYKPPIGLAKGVFDLGFLVQGPGVSSVP